MLAPKLRCRSLLAGCFALALVACTVARPPARTYELGRDADAATLAAATRTITPDGAGLPAGRGSVASGEQLYETRCANCHDTPAFPALWGGLGSLKHAPLKTVGSFWPYAPIVYDYIRRAMPPASARSLRPDELYALTAFILFKNGIVRSDSVLDAPTLSRIVMPNRGGFFVSDGKPDI